MAAIPIEGLQSVESVLNYTEVSNYRPTFYLYEPDPNEVESPRVSDKRSVPIHDIRAQMKSVTLDDHGFCFVERQLPAIDFFDPESVQQTYYDECKELVKNATGADRVLAFDHNVRDKELSDQPGVDFPVRFAHNDYTDASGPQRVRDLMGNQADELLKHRYQFINVWRPLRGPVLDTPLAVCDATSLEADDFIATDLKYRDRLGEIFSFSFNENHRWVYLREMLDHEILLLKCFDSATDGIARYTAHSAFRDPNAPPDTPVRRSIEVRTIAFYDPA